MFYTMAQAKQYFQDGYLVGFQLERFVLSPGWAVYLSSSGGVRPLVDARSHRARVFKTLDAAVAALVEIGFNVDRLT